MVLSYTGNDQKCTPVHLVASELGLPICCLLREMHAISGCNSVNSFSHTGKITAFQHLNTNSTNCGSGNVINCGEFSSLTLK